MLKRIAVIASGLLAVGALTAGSATAANAAAASVIHRGPDARPGVYRTTISCSGEVNTFQNDYNGGNGQYWYSRVGSPYQLLANTAHTGYCLEGSNYSHDVEIAIDGSNDICLQVESSGGVDGATCDFDSKAQALHFTGYDGSTFIGQWEFDQDTGGCIYQSGTDSPVAWHSCNINNTGDRWIEKLS